MKIDIPLHIGQQISARVLARTDSGDALVKLGDNVALINTDLPIGQDLNLIVTDIKDGVIYTKKSNSSMTLAMKMSVNEAVLYEMLNRDIPLVESNIKQVKQHMLETKMLKEIAQKNDLNQLITSKDFLIPAKELVLKILSNAASSQNFPNNVNSTNETAISTNIHLTQMENSITLPENELLDQSGEKITSTIVNPSKNQVSSTLIPTSINVGENTNAETQIDEALFVGKNAQSNSLSDEIQGNGQVDLKSTHEALGSTNEALKSTLKDIDSLNPTPTSDSLNTAQENDELAILKKLIIKEGGLNSIIEKFDLPQILKIFKNQNQVDIKHIILSLKDTKELSDALLSFSAKVSENNLNELLETKNTPLLNRFSDDESKLNAYTVKEYESAFKEVQKDIYYYPVPVNINGREERVDLYYKSKNGKYGSDLNILIGLNTQNFGLVQCLVEKKDRHYTLNFSLETDEILAVFKDNEEIIQNALSLHKDKNFTINWKAKVDIEKFFEKTKPSSGFDISV